MPTVFPFNDTVTSDTTGLPIAGVWVCVLQQAAVGVPANFGVFPGAPLAIIYTDGTAATVQVNPFQTDGFGNASWFAESGIYTVQLYGPPLSFPVIRQNLFLGAGSAASLQGIQGIQGIQGVPGNQGLAGVQGIPGSAGVNGTQGPTGVQGPANGNTILSGTVDPTSGQGDNGDFYLNTSTETIFGPRADGSWPAGVLLIGATGSAGSAGSTGSTGSVGPAGPSGVSPSGPANEVIATPNGSTGQAALRALVAADIPTLNYDASGAAIAAVSAIPTATASVKGLLVSADWATFNSKQAAITGASLTESGSSILTITGAVSALLSAVTIKVKQATSTVSGYLSSGDWTTFNAKQPAITPASLTEATSSVLTITGATSALLAAVTIAVKQASSSVNGYLSSTDWTTFNSKQAALGFTPASLAASNLFTGTLNTFPGIQCPIVSATTATNGTLALSSGTQNVDPGIFLAGSTNSSNGLYLDSNQVFFRSSAGTTTYAQVTSTGYSIAVPIIGTLGGWITNFVPALTPGGSMTLSSVTTSCQYIRIGPLIYFTMQLAFTPGGTFSSYVNASLPVAAVGGVGQTVSASIDNATIGTWIPTIAFISGTYTQIYAGGNVSTSYAALAVTAYITGFYRCA